VRGQVEDLAPRRSRHRRRNRIRSSSRTEYLRPTAMAKKLANTEARFKEYLVRLAEVIGHADRKEPLRPLWGANI